MLNLLLENLAQSIACVLVIAMIALRNRMGKRAGAYMLAALILGAVTLVPRERWGLTAVWIADNRELAAIQGLGFLIGPLILALQIIGPRTTRALHRRIVPLLLASVLLGLLAPEEDSLKWPLLLLAMLGMGFLSYCFLRWIVPLAWITVPFAILVGTSMLLLPAFAIIGGLGPILFILVIFWLPSFREWAPYTRPRWLPPIRPAHVNPGAPRPCFK